MRPFQHTIPLDEARAILSAHATPIARTEQVALPHLGNRVVAADLTATADVPPFTRAMMDGYAVRASDTTGATRDAPQILRVVDRVFTGEVSARALVAGECAEIATGAPLPVGADAVVMVEDSVPDAPGRVGMCRAVSAGQHVGRRGADIAAGAVVLRLGDLLLPSRVGAIAAMGLTTAPVFARPRVAIVSTGNEVVPPGTPLGPGQIHDINRFTVSAIVERHGGTPTCLEVAADTLAALDDALDDALECDLVVLSGGSSVGDRDLVIDVLSRRGRVHFHGVATKPGKPTAFGTIGTVPVFGMPGNPTSCLTNAYVLLVPFLRTLARLPAHAPPVVHAPLARRVTSGLGRTQFYTVRLRDGLAHPAFKASGDITSMAHADGYVEIAADLDGIVEGTSVPVTLFD